MYLFTRSARLGPGNLGDSMAWSIKITEKVNQISELDVSLWSTVFSPKTGTLAWTATVEDLAALEASDAKLMADTGYHSLVDDGAKFMSGDAIDDNLLRLIHADQDGASAQPQYASVVQAVLAPGSSVRGIELGVEIAQRAKKVTGRPTSFAAAETGMYGGVEWIAVYDSVEQLEKAGDALAADTTFGQFLDKEASKVYLSGVSTQTVYRRIL